MPDEDTKAEKKETKPARKRAAARKRAKKKAESKIDKMVRANKNHPDNQKGANPNQIVQPPSKEAIEDLKTREKSAQETDYKAPDWRNLPPAPKPATDVPQASKPAA